MPGISIPPRKSAGARRERALDPMPLIADRMITAGAVATAAAGNAVVWAQSLAAGNWTVGGVVTAITGVGGAAVGLAVLAIRQIGAARVDAKRQWDAAHRESFAGQIEELTESVARLRRSLHESRNESQARESAHGEEVARLTEQIRLLTEQVDLLHATNLTLNGEIARLNARIRELTAATQSVRVAAAEVRASMTGSGDAIPAAPADPPPPGGDGSS